jgi:N-acyl-D-amino-acid deacylase
MTGMLIRGGRVVDGTGAPAYAADVRVRDGTIVEIAPNLSAAPEERVFDAAGCEVTPGFIEPHTHMDAVMWWQPSLDPLPGYGVTTVVMGNCGFSAAPVSKDPEVRLEMVKIFTFFEEVPIDPFLQQLPWDWNSWSEYRQSMQKNAKASANLAAFVGHIAIRLAVMGMDAWTRAATPDEIKKMAAQLEDALNAGALGLSSNFMDHDSQDRPVPSLMADDAELLAFIEVLERHPGTSFQLILDTFFHLKAPETMERLARLCKGRKVRVQLAGAGALLNFQEGIRPKLWELNQKMKDDGLDFWPSFAHVPPTTALNFFSSSSFAQANEYVWHEVVQAPTEDAKLALLRDPQWRARARDSWDNKAFKQSLVGTPWKMLLMDSATGAGPVGLNLKELADKWKMHPSDALADWVLANGVNSIVNREPHAQNQELTVEMIKNPQALGNISDAGAHGQMLCGGGENVLFFTEYMAKGQITLEEAVHAQTGKQAKHFGFGDRGVLAVGKRADIAVFNLDEIEQKPLKRVFDVPDGKGGNTWRFSRDPAPMRLTVVNGVPTFDHGAFTGACPGQIIGPSVEPVAMAAE